MAIGTILVYAYEISINVEPKKAMTIAFTLFVMYQLFNALNGRADSDKSSRYLYLGILLSFILQLLIIYIHQLQIIFRTTSIGMIDWALIIIVALTIILLNKIMVKVIK